MYPHGIGNRIRWSGSPEPQDENPKRKGEGKEEDGGKARKVVKTRGGKAGGGRGGGRQGITPTNFSAGPCSRWKNSKLVTVEPC